MPLLRFWFSLTAPVDRRHYLVHGAALMALKYAVDAGIVRLATGAWWSPLDYVSPVWSTREAALAGSPTWLMAAMALWTLPFLWIGVSMTMRRAVDAGLSGWLCLLFFVPFLNYVLMLVLSLLPTRPHTAMWGVARDAASDSKLREALLALAAGLAVSVPTVLISVLVVRSYSTPLFLGTPFSLGAIGAYVLNRTHPRSLGYTFEVVFAGLVLLSGTVLLFALEGALCLFMALPLAGTVAWLGTVLGRALALHAPDAPTHAALIVIGLPALAVVDARHAPTPSHEVVTSVVIDAPREVVWHNVVTFAELEEPREWLFRLGVAYPRRARIDGSGVGAVRYCEFSTGDFVEPITEWEAPRRLAFDIVRQAAPMRELSPYRHVRAAHLDGYFRATWGRFDLEDLPGGALLVGTTRYEVRMYPQAYWALFADAIVERIHMRVLAHIEGLSERGDIRRQRTDI